MQRADTHVRFQSLHKSRLTALAALTLTAVFMSASAVALALPRRDAPGAGPTEPKPPAAHHDPVVTVDLTRQTTERNAVHITGWTADPDAPTTPLRVQVSIDKRPATTLTANTSRPDVGARSPTYGATHGFDVVVPASSTSQKVCVTAVNVGPGADTTRCQQIDDIVEFDANAISYDTAKAKITATNLDELDSLAITNKTSEKQSTTISGVAKVTDTQGWKDTEGVTVNMSYSVKVGVPLVAETTGSVSLGGSLSFEQNGSHADEKTFSWQQPVIVPAESKVVATVAVTRSTLEVPYTLSGTYLYSSGARDPGTVDGVYSGVNSHDLQVKLEQFEPDGSRAARPILQPAATLLKVS